MCVCVCVRERERESYTDSVIVVPVIVNYFIHNGGVSSCTHLCFSILMGVMGTI